MLRGNGLDCRGVHWYSSCPKPDPDRLMSRRRRYHLSKGSFPSLKQGARKPGSHQLGGVTPYFGMQAPPSLAFFPRESRAASAESRTTTPQSPPPSPLLPPVLPPLPPLPLYPSQYIQSPVQLFFWSSELPSCLFFLQL
jgi:hypothetical protein